MLGWVRLALACHVFASHMYSSLPSVFSFDAGTAVQCFFVISGFTIALITSNHLDWTFKNCLHFFTKRYFRIWPLHILVVGFSMHYLPLPALNVVPKWRWLAYLQNFYLFAADSGAFFEKKVTGAIFPSLKNIATPLTLINQPSWSLGTELGFYALTPFLVTLKTRYLAAITALLYAFQYKLSVFTNLSADQLVQLQKYYFPFQLKYFLMGILGYRAWTQIKKVKSSKISEVSIALFSIGLLSFLYQVSIIPEITLIIAFALPLIHNEGWQNRPDRFAADLSFSVYILHLPLLQIIVWPVGTADLTKFISILIIAALVTFILDRPLRIFRDFMLKKVFG